MHPKISVVNGRIQLNEHFSHDVLCNIAGGVFYQFAPHARDAEYILGDWVRRDVALGWVPAPKGWDVELVCLSAEQVLQLEATLLSIRSRKFNEDIIDVELAKQYRQTRRTRRRSTAVSGRRTSGRGADNAGNSPSDSLIRFRKLVSQFKLQARDTHNAILE